MYDLRKFVDLFFNGTYDLKLVERAESLLIFIKPLLDDFELLHFLILKSIAEDGLSLI